MTNAKHERRKKVVCLFNSIVNVTGLDVRFVGFSGGDVRFVEIFRRIKDLDKLVITPLIGKRICELNKMEATFILTTKELHTRNILFTDFSRIIRAMFFKIELKDKDIIYCASDFLMDTLPAFVLKLHNKKPKMVVCIFLIVPTLFRDYSRSFTKDDGFSLPTFGRILHFISQQFTIFLGKRWANQLLVLNSMDKEYLVEKRGVEESKVSVVNGGVDYLHIKSLGAKTKFFDGVFLGRFHPQKGISELIKIWKLVCGKKPNAKLCVIGTGPKPLVEEITTAIEKNKLSNNVTLVGSKTGDEKFSLLKSSNVFLCPSYYESFAIVIAEAMACALPVVAFDLPIYKDIYGENISRVPVGDVNQFAAVILNFLDDEKLRRTFGLEGQKFVQKYDWNEIAKKEHELMIGKLTKENERCT